MTKPENVTLDCTYCGHEWVEPLSSLKAAKIIVYRGDEDTTARRSLDCPNCQRAVIVTVPKAWLDDE